MSNEGIDLSILSSSHPVISPTVRDVSLSKGPALAAGSTDWLRQVLRNPPKRGPFDMVHKISKSYASYVDAVVKAGGGEPVLSWDNIKNRTVEELFRDILGPNNIVFKYKGDGWDETWT